jgi:hypothetical protein
VQTTRITASWVSLTDVRLRCKIAAWARSLVVNCATDADANVSLECNAAPRMAVCPAHVNTST